MAAYQDDKLVKKAFAKVAYTKEQVDSIQKCMDPVNGPLYFITNYMYIQHPIRGKQKIELYDYQYGLLNNYHKHRKSIAMMSRQSGKTTIAAGYLLWYAMFMKDSYILVTSNNYEGAQDIMSRLRFAYESMPDYIRAGVKEYNKRSITFDNDSKIVSTATTANTGRGRSLTLVYSDELSSLPPNIAKEWWSSLSPSLSTGGKIIVTSTPFSDEDQFAQLWFGANKLVDRNGNDTEVGENGFSPFMATWVDHPERDEKWAEEERTSIGEARFRREHQCEFITSEDTLINGAKLLRLESIQPIRRSGNVRWFKEIDPDKIYIVALDPSMGLGGDNSAIQILELPTLIQVGEWCGNTASIEEQVRIMKNILEELYQKGRPELYWSVESNSLGEAALVVIRDTGEDNFPGTMLHDTKNRLQGRTGRRAGFVTTNKSKLEACAKLKFLVESGKLKLNSKGLISELKVFVARANSFSARPGQTDDLIMALILALRMTESVALWDDKSQEAINSNISIFDDESDSYENSPMPMFI